MAASRSTSTSPGRPETIHCRHGGHLPVSMRIHSKRLCRRPRESGPVTAAVVSLFLCASTTLNAQEMQPRAYLPVPVGVHFIVTTYGRSSGGLLFDPSLPLEDSHVVPECASPTPAGCEGGLPAAESLVAAGTSSPSPICPAVPKWFGDRAPAPAPMRDDVAAVANGRSITHCAARQMAAAGTRASRTPGEHNFRRTNCLRRSYKFSAVDVGPAACDAGRTIEPARQEEPFA